jgi:Arc/MetJ-type ribon-helix-helix transcriptional regulator
MAQVNLHVDPDFEAELAELRRVRAIRTKSEAIRLAVRETLERSRRVRRLPDFTSWVGLGRQVPENVRPRFASDDELWGEADGH